MASLSYDEQKQRWRIQFKAPDGSRKSLGLKASRKAESRAQTFRGRVEELLQARMTGTAIPQALAVWLRDLPDETHQQLSAAGLAEPRASSQLGPFLDDWLSDRASQKPSTIITWGNAQRNLIEFFGHEKNLRDITEEDAERFLRWLKTDQKLAENTIRKRCSITKQFFRSAVKARLLEKSPFLELKGSMSPNKRRQQFVTPEEAEKVLRACPDAEWRLLFGLARWGALRIPSEAFALRWEDVDRENEVLHIHASKTEHHESGGDRMVPIFLELKPLLQEVFDAAPEGSEYVIEQYRGRKNLGTRLKKIIRRAGVVVWPRAWQNLRASRCTELSSQFPGHVVAAWCGHSERIAEAHYWMTTSDDIRRATTESITIASSGGANVVQQAVANGVNGLQAVSSTNEKTPVFPGFAAECESVRMSIMGDEGLEPKPIPPAKILASREASVAGGAYVVHSTEGGAPWQQIRGLLQDCPDLPETARQRLIAIGDLEVRSGRGFAEAFDAAFRRLNRQSRLPGCVSLVDLRPALAEFSRQEFDEGLLQARREGKYSLSIVEGRYPLSKAEREACLVLNNSLYLLVRQR